MQRGKRQELKCVMQASGSTASISVIGDIGYFPLTMEYFSRKVTELIEQGAVNLELYICTYGGSLFDAYEMYNQIARFPGKKTCRLGAICASAGTILPADCQEVIACSNTIMMIHNPNVEVSEGSSDSEKEASANLLQVLKNNVVKVYKKLTGLDEATISEMMDNTTWMNAETALKHGFITAISDEQPASIEEVIDYDEVMMSVPESLRAQMNLSQPFKPTNNNFLMKKESVLALMGLPKDASEDSFLESVATMHKKLSETEAALQSEREKVKTEKAKMLIDSAIAEGKITEQEREVYMKDASDNPELVQRVLGKLKPVVRASGNIIPAKEDPTRATWNLETWMKSDMAGLISMKEADPSKYNSLYEAHYGKVAN